jgi:hypothetical protein
MKKSLLRQLAIGGTLFATLYAAPAHAAGATRTWVSGVGNDADPCSRTAPCKTFAGALAKTAAGGEISVMDSGAFGQVTIAQAVTINGEGNLASILVPGGTGINVVAGPNDRVIIRNLSINGAGGGNNGILVSSGNVTVDKCLIYGFTTGFFGGIGINIAANSLVHVDVRDTAITNTTHGVLGSTSGGGGVSVVSLDNVRINDATGYGVGAISSSVFIAIRNAFIGFTGTGGILNSGPGSSINIDHSELTHNITAVSATAAGAIVRLNDVSIYENNTGLAISGGATIATAGNNKLANSPGAATNGTVTTF